MEISEMRPAQRLEKIVELIELRDHQAGCVDGPVPNTIQMMKESDIKKIYDLAVGNES